MKSKKAKSRLKAEEEAKANYRKAVAAERQEEITGIERAYQRSRKA
jgi:hypothetical protein